MKITTIFNEHSSFYEKEHYFNMAFVYMKIAFLKDIYKNKGYLYIEEVFENLGIKWNPYEMNYCWIYERDKEIEFDVDEFEFSSSKKIRINIYNTQ